MLSATVERFGGGEATQHRVRDLSPGGVRIDKATDLKLGATVLVTVGRLESIGATVAWVKDGSAGLKFAHIVDPADARAKAAIAPVATERPSNLEANLAPKAGWISDINDAYRK